MTCHKQLRLQQPSRLYSGHEVLAEDSEVPKNPGVYAWFFLEIPPQIPQDQIEKCVSADNYILLYVGQASKQTLFDRVRYHYRGKAYGSTLRLSLGCLLSEKLDIKLHCVGGGNCNRFTFNNGEKDGENVLSQWMKENAFVVWIEDSDPRRLEKKIINDNEIFLPLNLGNNRKNLFYKTLSQIRSDAKESARLMAEST